ncbi:Chromosome transmission fidelity protein 18 [Aspergillus tubingensis]|uniref:uncharacterized protein n=1 Tax=Aspergillus tubingensis TaxID=5068 RepID=UPI0015799571|nr:chromosome transmission fidelity protein 18 [Aspergillus tubingensis]GFN18086.1 chromosome transmission fidelity protein 18 [Aspergillus tubingensis]
MPESVKSTSTLDDASSSYSVSSTASTLKGIKATSKKWLPSKEKKEETNSSPPKPASPKPAKEKSRAPSTNYTTLATYLSLK